MQFANTVPDGNETVADGASPLGQRGAPMLSVWREICSTRKDAREYVELFACCMFVKCGLPNLYADNIMLENVYFSPLLFKHTQGGV